MNAGLLPCLRSHEALALGANVDEIAKLYADLVAASFIEPTTWQCGAEAGTDPSCGSPQRAGKGPCGVSGTGIRATALDDGEKGYNAPLGVSCNSMSGHSMIPFDRR